MFLQGLVPVLSFQWLVLKINVRTPYGQCVLSGLITYLADWLGTSLIEHIFNPMQGGLHRMDHEQH